MSALTREERHTIKIEAQQNLGGSYYPDRVRLVVALMPTHVVWQGIDARARFRGDPAFASPGKSRWSLNGNPLPFVRKFVSAVRLQKPLPNATVDQYAPVLDKRIDPAALIPVERIRGPVFLVSAGDDLGWPSLRMGREAKARLAKRESGAEVQLWEYPMAGHAMGPPGMRTNLSLGGTLSASPGETGCMVATACVPPHASWRVSARSGLSAPRN
jgi:hypothetical protein